MWIRVNKSTGEVYADVNQSPLVSTINHSFWVECNEGYIPALNGTNDIILFSLYIALTVSELTANNVIKSINDGVIRNKYTKVECDAFDLALKVKEPEEVVISSFRKLDGHVFWKKGFHYVATAGQTTLFYEKFSKSLLLSGGGYKIDSNAVFGDNCTLEIVDKDNMFGYGAGVVLATFISTDFAWSNKEYNILTEDAKQLYAGLYLRFTYVSNGEVDVNVIAWYNFRQM